MVLALDEIDRLLPPDTPPGLGARARSRVGRIEGGVAGPLGRAGLWSFAVTSHFRSSMREIGKHFGVRRFDREPVMASVGFFAMDAISEHARQVLSNVVSQSGYFFGAALYDMRWRTREIKPFPLLRLKSGYPIHVVHIPGTYVPHTLIHPANSASTAWGRQRKGARGVLTCKHAVVGLKVGASVRMSDGSRGRLIKFGAGSVDAAFIQTVKGAPKGRVRLSIEMYPVNGDTVSVHFPAGSGSAQILNSWYFADNLDAYNSMRVFIDRWGKHGDSGALVSTVQGAGVGIYTGVFQGNGLPQGMCQYLGQAVDNLNLVLFS